MNTLPSFSFLDMDASNIDDKMDVASSPYRQTDDLDLELDLMREPSVEPMNDKVFDDVIEPEDPGRYDLSGNNAHIRQDDDMLDEETTVEANDQIEDYNMESSEQFADREGEDDEDILYEDEDDGDTGNHDRIDQLESHVHEDEDDVPQQEYDFIEGETNGPTGGVDEEHPGQEDNIDEQTHLDNTDSNVQAPISLEEKSGQSHSVEEIESQDLNNRSQEQATDPSTLEDNTIPVEQANDDDNLTSTLKETTTKLHETDAEAKTEAKTEDHANVKQVLTHQASDSSQLLHPVKLIYLGEEMSLFPPRVEDQSGTFFLSDASLAFDSLEKLLGACREILTGSIGHDDELVLDINVLGLHICEDSKYATNITLSQILEIYLMLSHNEQAENIEPLYCTLSSRVCLATQYAYLASAARDGRPFSEIAAEYLDSPDEEEDYGADSEEVKALQDSTAGEHEDEEVGEKENLSKQVSTEQDSSEYPTQPEQEIGPDASTGSGTAREVDPSDELLAPVKEDDESPANEHDGQQLDNAEANQNNTLDEDFINDNESSSSHTVQADPVATHDSEALDQLFEDENQDEQPPAEQAQQEENFNEDLFVADEGDYDDPTDIPAVSEHQDDQLDQIRKVGVAETSNLDGELQESAVDNGQHEDQLFDSSLLDTDTKPSNTSKPSEDSDKLPPSTPSRPMVSKRKAVEEDDEFDLLDSNTPEPKRRRPS